MIDAYDRVALKVAGSFGLQLGARVPDAREFEISAYNCELLAKFAERLGKASLPQSDVLARAAEGLKDPALVLQEWVTRDSDNPPASASTSPVAATPSSASPAAASGTQGPESKVAGGPAAPTGNALDQLPDSVSRVTHAPAPGPRPAAPGSAFSSSDELQEKTHGAFFQASATLFLALRRLWRDRAAHPSHGQVSQRSDLDQLLPGGEHARLPTAAWFMRAVTKDVYLWTRMAEDFVALRVVTFIHHVLFQLRNLLVFALTGALALVLVVAAYPLQPSRFVTVFSWLLMLFVIAGSFAAILFMERNEILSRLGGSGPGRLNLNVTFVGQLLMYVLLPAAVVVASVFPEVSELLFSWFDPLARLLP